MKLIQLVFGFGRCDYEKGRGGRRGERMEEEGERALVLRWDGS